MYSECNIKHYSVPLTSPSQKMISSLGLYFPSDYIEICLTPFKSVRSVALKFVLCYLGFTELLLQLKHSFVAGPSDQSLLHGWQK